MSVSSIGNQWEKVVKISRMRNYHINKNVIWVLARVKQRQNRQIIGIFK